LRGQSPFATAVVTSAMCAPDGQVRRHRVDVIREVLQCNRRRPGNCPDAQSLHAVPTLARDTRGLPSEAVQRSTMRVDSCSSARGHYRPARDGDLRDKSPRETAVVVTSAIVAHLTGKVRRIEFRELKLCGGSFHVHAKPGTRPWPPSCLRCRPSRATRVTSDANERSCSPIRVDRFLPLGGSRSERST